MAKLSKVLKERGYAYQFSSETLEEITDREKRTVYLGIDPSADSLHVGNLQAMLVLRRFLEDGHKVILLVGGGTGMIGDPSGKSEERNLLDDATIEKNANAIEKQAKQLFAGLDFKLVNNAEWLRKLNYIEFLRDIGKHFSVNAMLQRDSVKDRLQNQEQGISYTEFSYMLLQAYDFLHLNQEYGCDVQIGASDQWGNIISGVDLIRRKAGGVAYGLTSPLLINKSTGKKFGKSEQGAVWLDGAKTHFFDFYQFFVKVSDESVEELLFKLTVLEPEEINRIVVEHSSAPNKRYAQKKLAWSITAMVHGEEDAHRAELVSSVLYGEDGSAQSMTDDDWNAISEAAPQVHAAVGANLVEVLVESGLASSKRDARQLISDGAVRINYQAVKEECTLQDSDMPNGRGLIKVGKQDARFLVRA
jgi:tyrosyl-tRNA synthetase